MLACHEGLRVTKQSYRISCHAKFTSRSLPCPGRGESLKRFIGRKRKGKIQRILAKDLSFICGSCHNVLSRLYTPYAIVQLNKVKEKE